MQILRRIGLGLLIVVAIALLADGFMALWTEVRLQRKIAAIRANGDPASIADLADRSRFRQPRMRPRLWRRSGLDSMRSRKSTGDF